MAHSRRYWLRSTLGWVAAVAAAPPLRAADARWPYRLDLEGLTVVADFQADPLRPLWNEIWVLSSAVQKWIAEIARSAPLEPGEAGPNYPPERSPAERDRADTLPIQVHLFAERHTYYDYITRYFPTAPRRPALYVRQGEHHLVLAAYGQQLTADLRHEVTHAAVQRSAGTLPLWIDEGLAEYFEFAEPRDNPDFARVCERMVRGQAPLPTELARQRELAQFSTGDYEAAFAWTLFYLEGPESARRAWARHVARLAQVTSGRDWRAVNQSLWELVEPGLLAECRSFYQTQSLPPS